MKIKNLIGKLIRFWRVDPEGQSEAECEYGILHDLNEIGILVKDADPSDGFHFISHDKLYGVSFYKDDSEDGG